MDNVIVGNKMVDLDDFLNRELEKRQNQDIESLANFYKICEEVKAIKQSSEYSEYKSLVNSGVKEDEIQKTSSYLALSKKFDSLQNAIDALRRVLPKQSNCPEFFHKFKPVFGHVKESDFEKELTTALNAIKNIENGVEVETNTGKIVQPVFDQNGSVKPELIGKVCRSNLRDYGEFSPSLSNGLYVNHLLIGNEPNSQYIKDLSKDSKSMVKLLLIAKEKEYFEDSYGYKAPQVKTLSEETAKKIKQTVAKAYYAQIVQEAGEWSREVSEKVGDTGLSTKSTKSGDTMGDLFNSQSTQGKGKGKVGSQKEND